jgi:hypothetical protein
MWWLPESARHQTALLGRCVAQVCNQVAVAETNMKGRIVVAIRPFISGHSLTRQSICRENESDSPPQALGVAADRSGQLLCLVGQETSLATARTTAQCRFGQPANPEDFLRSGNSALTWLGRDGRGRFHTVKTL